MYYSRPNTDYSTGTSYQGSESSGNSYRRCSPCTNCGKCGPAAWH